MSSRKHRRDSYESDQEEHRRKHKKSKKKSSEVAETISTDDYYEKATEFRLWLTEEKGRYFDELSSEDARHYFKKFVKAWNRNDLDDKYYKGINPSQLASSDRTGYRWAFADKLDQHELDRVRDSVDTATAGTTKKQTGPRRNVGPSLPSASTSHYDQTDEEDRKEAERAARKREQKIARQKHEEYLDEVAPRETGREAMLAKRRAINAFHRRERSPDIELNESELYGGGDDFQSRLAAQKRAEERRQARRAEKQQQRLGPVKEKLAEYKAKEDATMEMLRKMAEERKNRGAF